MNVASVMTRDVKTVKPTDTAKSAVVTMNKHHIGSVIVSDGKEVLGIITERDVLKRVVEAGNDASKIICKGIMSTPIYAVEPSTGISEAIDTMVKHHIKKLIVIEGVELVGILTATDCLKSGRALEQEALEKLSEFFPVYTPGSSPAG